MQEWKGKRLLMTTAPAQRPEPLERQTLSAADLVLNSMVRQLVEKDANRTESPHVIDKTESTTVETTEEAPERDPESVERSELLTRFKSKGRKSGIKVTDEMVAKEAKSTWNTRTMVTWWKRNDKNCKAPHDRLIRAVLARDPASIWPRQ